MSTSPTNEESCFVRLVWKLMQKSHERRRNEPLLMMQMFTSLTPTRVLVCKLLFIMGTLSRPSKGPFQWCHVGFQKGGKHRLKGHRHGKGGEPRLLFRIELNESNPDLAPKTLSDFALSSTCLAPRRHHRGEGPQPAGGPPVGELQPLQ